MERDSETKKLVSLSFTGHKPRWWQWRKRKAIRGWLDHIEERMNGTKNLQYILDGVRRAAAQLEETGFPDPTVSVFDVTSRQAEIQRMRDEITERYLPAKHFELVKAQMAISPPLIVIDTDFGRKFLDMNSEPFRFRAHNHGFPEPGRYRPLWPLLPER